MAGRARKAPDKRWSTQRSVACYDAAGRPVAADDEDLHTVVVRWRVDGRQRKASFTGAQLAQTPALLADLAAAYHGDWEPDGRGRPAARRRRARRRHRDHLRTSYAKRRDQPRSEEALRQYDNELDFALEALRYAPDDPRLAHPGAEAGAPLLLDGDGLQTADLLALLDRRCATNLRTRASNALGAPAGLPRRPAPPRHKPTPPAPAARPRTPRAPTAEALRDVADNVDQLVERAGYLIDAQPPP